MRINFGEYFVGWHQSLMGRRRIKPPDRFNPLAYSSDHESEDLDDTLLQDMEMNEEDTPDSDLQEFIASDDETVDYALMEVRRMIHSSKQYRQSQDDEEDYDEEYCYEEEEL